MKKTFILSTFLVLSQSLWATSFQQRAAQVYLETDKNFDIDCYYSYNEKFKLISPASETVKDADSISRDFFIETEDKQVPMKFILKRDRRNFAYQVLIDEIHSSQGKLSKREFFIAPIKDYQFSQEFETSRIFCNVNFAYSYPQVLKDKNYHFNVHPNISYDWQNRLKVPVESYLANKKFESIIFLETGNGRGNVVNIDNFLRGYDPQLMITEVDSALEKVPEDVPLVVAPAGNSRFIIEAKDQLNITFTGGNHNYCIWNVTRHVVEALMRSKTQAKVTLTYDTKSIIAQAEGIEGLSLNFPSRDVNRSNLLKDLLKPEVQRFYHSEFLNYFHNFMAREFSGMYRSYKIDYKAEGYESSEVIKGDGIRDLELNFVFI